MEEFLSKLGIEGKLNKSSSGVWVLDIADSDEYGKVYSKLDKSKLVNEITDSSQITFDTASIQYESDDYQITLLGDFANDGYKMTIKEIK